MKKKFPSFIVFLLAGTFGLSPGTAATDPVPVAPTRWESDYAKALVQAKKEHKLVLLNFTGSDWCVWCRRLHEEVFSQQPFAAYAQEHLVLVELDFPRRESQAPALKSQNAQLDAKYAVTGYPTIILVDSTGKEFGRTGYMQGGAKTFVRELKRLATKATTSTGISSGP